ncbi:hypothetical protein Xets_00858 [Xenorhabdus sp. TS4]|nr:hypothetical protein [Xenorhabdus sp. TS4]
MRNSTLLRCIRGSPSNSSSRCTARPIRPSGQIISRQTLTPNPRRAAHALNPRKVACQTATLMPADSAPSPLSPRGSVQGQTVAGLPVSFSAGGGKWAMVSGGHGVPNHSVPAAQSPFNIMQGDCAKFAVRPCRRAQPRRAAHIAQSALCLAPPLSASRGAPHKADAFCCQHRRTLSANPVPILSSVPRSGKNSVFFSGLEWLRQRPL